MKQQEPCKQVIPGIKRNQYFSNSEFIRHVCCLASGCFFLILFFTACDDFLERDISDDVIIDLVPTSGWSSKNSEINFSWGKQVGATEYNFQLVSPSFDSPHELLIDSLVSFNNLKLVLGAGKYEWKINGYNSVSETNYSISSFEIIFPAISPIPVFPSNMDTIRTEVVQFCWTHPEENQTFNIEVFSDADLKYLVETKEIKDTCLFIKLEENGQYFWRLNSTYQNNISSDYSATSSFYLIHNKTIDISNETVILRSPVSADYISTNKVSFWWDEMNGATNYTLQVVSPNFSETTSLIINEVLATTSKDYELEEGNYQWRVKASNENYSTGFTTGSFQIYRSDISDELVSLINPLNESILTGSEINFLWEQIEGTEYQFVLRKDDWESGTILHQKTVNTNDLMYSLQDGLYYWGIKAKDLTNFSETEFSVSSFSIDNTAPEPPALTYPVNNSELSKGELNFQWSDDNSENDLKYGFQLFKESNSKNELVYENEINSTEFSYEINNYGTYYWQVKATDKAGNSSDYSTLSEFTVTDDYDIADENIILNAPFNGHSTTNTEISFWWEEIDNAQEYVFQLVKPDFTHTEELVNESSLTANKLTLTLTAGNYQWRVKAKNTSSQTAYSSVYSLTIKNEE